MLRAEGGGPGARGAQGTVRRQAWGWLDSTVFPSLEELVRTTGAHLGKQLDDQHQILITQP